MANKRKKRDDGLYLKQFSTGKKADGSYIRKSVYARTQKELEEKYYEVMEGTRLGFGYNAGNTSFSNLAEIWLDNIGAGMSEKWKYRQNQLINKHLLPSLGRVKLRDLKAIHLQSIISEKAKEGLSTATMKQIKQTAARIVEMAVESDLLPKNVFRNVKVPRIDPKEREALDEDQIKMVNDTWSTHFMGYPTMIMLYCGLRKGELLALQWRDIDLDRDVIRVTKSLEFLANRSTIKSPKSRAGKREVPIPLCLHNVLEQVQGDPNAVVCPSSSGEFMTDSAFHSAWNSYMNHLNLMYGGKKASRTRPKIDVIKKFTPHMLRHTYATMLYDAGVDIKSAQKFLGHASIEMTLSVYTHLTKFKVEGAISNLNSHIKEMGYGPDEEEDEDDADDLD